MDASTAPTPPDGRPDPAAGRPVSPPRRFPRTTPPHRYRPLVRTRGLWIWWMATASAAALAGIVLLLVVSPSGDPSAPPPPATAEPVVAEEPAPPPEPPPPAPVTGTVTGVALTDLSVTGSGLRPDGSAADAEVPVDQAAVDTVVTAVSRWLDAHLSSAHEGHGGEVPEGFDGPTDAAATGLAHPDRAATAARYALTVGVRGEPEWVSAQVTVDREDGTVGLATFVFAPTDGAVALVAVHPGEGTAPPVDEDRELAEATDAEGTT